MCATASRLSQKSWSNASIGEHRDYKVVCPAGVGPVCYFRDTIVRPIMNVFREYIGSRRRMPRDIVRESLAGWREAYG